MERFFKMSSIKTIRDRYLRYLKLERNYSGNTLEAYAFDMDDYLAWAAEEGVDLLQATTADIERYATAVREQGKSATTLARRLSGLRSLYRFLLMDHYIDVDPTELLDAPVLGQHLPEVLTTAEVDRMKAGIDVSKWEGQRNRAIIEVLFSCGLRVSELVSLHLSDLYLDQHFVRVLGKGQKERLVPISDAAIRELQLWFIRRNELKIKAGEADYVFLNRRGNHLTRTMILIMLKGTAAAAGIKKTVSPHTLRHSFATELLKGGADLRAIQAMLGHESIRTTEIYMHMDTTQLREEILEHHPRNIRRAD